MATVCNIDNSLWKKNLDEEELKLVTHAKTRLDGSNVKKATTTGVESRLSKIAKIPGEIKNLMNNNDEKYHSIKDSVSDVFKPERKSAAFRVSIEKTNSAWKAIGDDADLGDQLSSYYTTSFIKAQIDAGINPADVMYYKEYMADNPTQGLSGFKSFVDKLHNKNITTVGNDPRTAAVVNETNSILHQYGIEMNKYLGKDEWNIEAYNSKDLSGVQEQISLTFMMAKDNDAMRQEIETMFNHKMEDIMADPKLFSTASVYMMNMGVKRAKLFAELSKDDVSKQFTEDLRVEMDKVEILSASNIKALEDGSKLKGAYNALEYKLGDVDVLRAQGDYGTRSDLDIMETEMRTRMADMIATNKDIYGDDDFVNMIARNYETYPNLHKMLIGDDTMVKSGLVTEMEKIMSDTDLDSVRYNIDDFRVASADLKTLQTEVNMQIAEESKNVLQRVQENYPGYEILSVNGTRMYDANGKVVDIMDKNWVPGSITGIMNPKDITKNFIDGEMLNMFGDDYATGMINNNKFIMIPQEQADLIAKVKAPVLSEGLKNSWVAKVGNTFRKWNLLNPARIVKYNVTGTLGNVALTLQSDPRAFLNWPSGYKAAYYFMNKDKNFYDLYPKESDEAQLFEKIFEHSGAFMGVDMEELGVKSSVIKDIEDAEAQGVGNLKSAVDKVMSWTGGSVQFRELGARYALAKTHLDDMRVGKFDDSNMIGAQMARIKAEEDPFKKAAMLAHEQMNDYSDISNTGRKINSFGMMFFTYTEGISKRYYRQFQGIYKSTVDNLKSGDYKAVGKTALKTGMTAAMIGGLVSTGWNFMMNQTGMLSDDEYELMKEKNNEGLPGFLNTQGISGDSFIYIPGTNIQAIDSILGIGAEEDGDLRANVKFNIFEGVTDLMPYIDGSDPIEKLTNKFASSMHPMYKMPFEYALGGTFYEGYGLIEDSEWDSKSTFQKVAEKGSGLFGMNEFVPDVFSAVNGEAGPAMSDGAMNLKWMLSDIDTIKYEGFDDNKTAFASRVTDGMRNLDVDYTLSALADYIRYLEGIGEDASSISTTIKSAIKSNTLFGIANQDARNTYYANLDADGQARFMNTLSVQQQFLDAIGFVW